MVWSRDHYRVYFLEVIVVYLPEIFVPGGFRVSLITTCGPPVIYVAKSYILHLPSGVQAPHDSTPAAANAKSGYI
jgi:hypothetical protein